MNSVRNIQRAGTKLGNKISSVGRAMTASLTLPIAGAGALALKTAADYEKLRVSMDTLNGSVEEGARNFERLKRFSATTPFQLQDLAKAQNMLQGFGLEADEAFQSIKMIGDISAVSGGSIEGIGIAFGQAAAEGRLMTRDIRQLINQGVPAIKLLADTMGVAQSEVLDLASQGEISFDILQQSFRDATSEGGMFADGMKKQSQTISGLFSTLKDNVSLSLGELGQTISETLNLKELIPQITSNIQSVTAAFKNLSDESRTNILKVAGLIGAGGPIALAVGALITAVSSISLPVLGVVAAIGGIGFAFKKAYEQSGSFVGAMQLVLDKMLNHTVSVVQDMLRTMDWAGFGVFDGAISALEDLKRNVDATADFTPLADAANFIKDTFSSLKSLFGGFDFKQINQISGEIWKAGVNASSAIGNTNELAKRSNEYWNQFKVNVEGVSAKFPEMTKRMQAMANAEMVAMDIANQFTNSFGQGMSNIIVQGEKVIDVLKNIGKLLLSSAIQRGLSILLTGGLGGDGYFGSKGGLFGNLFSKVFKVNDALVRSDGSIVKFNPKDNILAMKDFGNLQPQSSGMSQTNMQRAFEGALRKFVRSVPDRKIFEMAEKGKRAY